MKKGENFFRFSFNSINFSYFFLSASIGEATQWTEKKMFYGKK